VSEALADVLHTYVATGDKPTMERQYKAIIAASEEASTYLTIESKSPEVEVISHAGYTYFGNPGDSYFGDPGYFGNPVDSGHA
jgi:hypothetical protein